MPKRRTPWQQLIGNLWQYVHRNRNKTLRMIFIIFIHLQCVNIWSALSLYNYVPTDTQRGRQAKLRTDLGYKATHESPNKKEYRKNNRHTEDKFSPPCFSINELRAFSWVCSIMTEWLATNCNIPQRFFSGISCVFPRYKKERAVVFSMRVPVGFFIFLSLF